MARAAPGASCVVAGPLAATLRLSRYLGLSPLSFQGHERGATIQISPTYTKCGDVIVTIVNLITIFTLVRGIQLNQPSRPVQLLAYTVEALLVMITASCMVYSARGRMQCIIQSHNRAEQIRSQLKIQPWPAACDKIIIALYKIWIALSLIATVIDTFTPLVGGKDITSTYKVWLVTMRGIKNSFDWCIQLGIYQFTLLVLHVKTCFIAVNESISRILIHEFKAEKQQEASILLGDNRSHKLNNKFRGINRSVDSMSSATRRDSDVKPSDRASPFVQASIRQLFSCYASACGVVRAVDRAHGLALMLVLAVTFLRLVLKPYYFINDFFKAKSTDPLSFYMKFIQVYWILVNLVNLVTVVEPCHRTHLEMLRTRELVCQLSRRVEPLQPLAVELEQFCKHLLLNQVAYRPLNVTTVSRHLILTILGNITTYLVVIVEID